MKEFINLKLGSMSVKEYALKFALLSKYAKYLVANSRDLMTMFVTTVSDIVEEECHVAILHNDMFISCFMVFY